MTRCKQTILEPIMDVETYLPNDFAGDIMGDFNGRRGRVSGMEQRGSLTVIKAQVPVSEMSTYEQTLTSTTGGCGTYHMAFSHYEEVPQLLQAKIIAAAKGEATPAGQPTTASGATPSAPGSPPQGQPKVLMLPFRITGADGSTVVVGVQAGGTATFRPAGRASDVLSADCTANGARVHVSEIAVDSDGKTGGVMEQLVVDGPRRTRVTVNVLPGMAAVELLKFPKR